MTAPRFTTFVRRRPFGWRALVDRARALAEATDRWFVSLSHGIAAPLARGRPDDAVPPAITTVSSASRRVDVLTGQRAPTVAANDETAPAGVIPLLRALGELVGTHRATGYRSLQFDDRFWGLLELLQTLTGRRSAPETADAPLPPVSRVSQGARS